MKDFITGGVETARVRAQAADEAIRRAERDRSVARWLTRRGHADLLPILGLEPPPVPECVRCGAPVDPPRWMYCGPRCKNAAKQQAWRDRQK